LTRLTWVCRHVDNHQVTTSALEGSISDRLGLKNRKVIGRHISLLLRLNLLQRVNGYLTTASDGQVLVEMARDAGLIDKELSVGERILYLRALILEASWQIHQMLRTATVGHALDSNSKTIDYFRAYQEKGPVIWNRNSIERAIQSSLNSGRISSSLRNKYKCVEKWLIQLRLLDKEPSQHNLTRSGRLVLDEIEKVESPLSSRIFWICASLIPDAEKQRFQIEDQNHLNDAENLLHTAGSLFERKSGMVDYRSAGLFTSVRLLSDKKIVLEEYDFYELLRYLWKAGRIRSIFSGRDGKPAYITY